MCCVHFSQSNVKTSVQCCFFAIVLGLRYVNQHSLLLSNTDVPSSQSQHQKQQRHSTSADFASGRPSVTSTSSAACSSSASAATATASSGSGSIIVSPSLATSSSPPLGGGGLFGSGPACTSRPYHDQLQQQEAVGGGWLEPSHGCKLQQQAAAYAPAQQQPAAVQQRRSAAVTADPLDLSSQSHAASVWDATRPSPSSPATFLTTPLSNSSGTPVLSFLPESESALFEVNTHHPGCDYCCADWGDSLLRNNYNGCIYYDTSGYASSSSASYCGNNYGLNEEEGYYSDYYSSLGMQRGGDKVMAVHGQGRRAMPTTVHRSITVDEGLAASHSSHVRPQQQQQQLMNSVPRVRSFDTSRTHHHGYASPRNIRLHDREVMVAYQQQPVFEDGEIVGKLISHENAIIYFVV